MALVKCYECGAFISDRASTCPHCGAPIEPIDYSQCRKLQIEWEGKWMAVDTKVAVFVNGNKLGEYSFVKGFSISTPITSQTMCIEVKYGFRTAKSTFNFNPNEDYSVSLDYSRVSGAFGIVLQNADGFIEVEDKCPLWMTLIAFLFPIIGGVYAFCVKNSKPSAFKSAITTSICGFLLGIIFMFILEIPFPLTIIYSIGGGGLIGVYCCLWSWFSWLS